MASEVQDNRGKKPRNYYVDYTKGNNRFGKFRRGATNTSNNARYKEAPDISFGNRGFLITSMDEVKCYLEMRQILEDYFETIYNTDKINEPNKDTSVEDELESELKQLRINRPFKQVKTHCRNTLFINIMKEFSQVDPIKLVDIFFDDLAESKKVRTSNTFKVLPVLDTFRCSTACAKESVSQLLQTIFKDETGPKNYFIEFQSRGNYRLDPEDKQKMVEGVADTISDLRPDWKVDRESADYIFVLIALKNVCCVSVVKDYFKRCKYNVVELCKDFA